MQKNNLTHFCYIFNKAHHRTPILRANDYQTHPGKAVKELQLAVSFLVFPHETLVPSEGRIRFILNPNPVKRLLSVVPVSRIDFSYQKKMAKSMIPELIHKLLTSKHKPNPIRLTSLTPIRRCLLWWSCPLISLLHG